MGAVESSIKAEIVRLAKREGRKLVAPLRDELRRLKNRDAERKTQVAGLVEQIRKFQAKERLAETTTKVAAGEVTGRLSPRLIRLLRTKLGLPQGKFAGLLGVSIGSVVNWESGKMNPRPEMRTKILSFRGMKRREAKAIVENLFKAPAPAKKVPAKKRAVATKRRRPTKVRTRRAAKTGRRRG